MNVFYRCISFTISKSLARNLTKIVLAPLKSDALFGFLRNSHAPAIQLDKDNCKRDQQDEHNRFRSIHALLQPEVANGPDPPAAPVPMPPPQLS